MNIHVNKTSPLHTFLTRNVFYIPSKKGAIINKYVLKNLNQIEDELNSKGLNFCYLKDLQLPKTFKKTINYFYPKFNLSDYIDSYFSDYITDKSDNEAGILTLGSSNNFTKFNNDEEAVFILRIYLQLLKKPDYLDYNDISFSLPSFEESDDYIELTDETKHQVNEIIALYDKLKTNGQLLAVAPILEKYIQNQDYDELSVLEIDDEHNINLLDYNKQIKLSPLTKALYLLFLNHPDGILLTDLGNHKEEFLYYYKAISLKENYDELLNSVDNILDINSREVYVHLSRIKSAFSKEIHPRLAENYYIKGFKNKPKYICIISKPILRFKNS